MLRNRETTSKSFLFLISILILLSDGLYASHKSSWQESACKAVSMIELESSSPDDVYLSEGTVIFHISIPAAGFLSMEWGDGLKERPGLEVLDVACHPLVNDRIAVIEQSISSLLIAFSRPGHYIFRFRSSETVRVMTDFSRAVAVESLHHLRPTSEAGIVSIRQTDFYPLPGVKNEWEEVDPDPSKSGWLEPILTLLVASVAPPVKNEWEEVDPDPSKRGRIPVISAQLVLFSSGNGATKNEWEEVDPDPSKGLDWDSRIVDGWLSFSGMTGGAASRGVASLRWIETAVPLELAYDELRGWLAQVLDVEIARSRLFTPGMRNDAFQLVRYQPGE